MCTYAHGTDSRRLRNIAKPAQKAAGTRRGGESAVYKYLHYMEMLRAQGPIYIAMLKSLTTTLNYSVA